MPPSADGTVFVVDDDPAVGDSLKSLLGSAGWRVRWWSSGEEFLDAYDSIEPGCLLLDLRMPGLSGIEVQNRLRAAGASLPVILLTAHGDVPTAVQAVKDGAFEFLEKPVRAEALINVISRAIDWHVRQQEHCRARADLVRRVASLSQREREVFELLRRGKAIKNISTQLSIDPKTVHSHRARVLEKLGVGSSLELVAMFAADPLGANGPLPCLRP
jgi:two-component system response regulator FixJ